MQRRSGWLSKVVYYFCCVPYATDQANSIQIHNYSFLNYSCCHVGKQANRLDRITLFAEIQ